MEGLAAITALLHVTNKLLDKTPDYNQKKLAKFRELELSFKEEVKRVYPDRDDDLIMNLREQIITFAKDF